jgi:putative phosphoribosyl transferase
MFYDRKDAGKKLAEALEGYGDKQDLIVLAIPRGGVEVGYEVATHLGADFSLIVTRKLPFPHNPESGFGAIAEDGSTFLFDFAAGELQEETVEEIKKEQQEEIARRVQTLRKGKPLPGLEGKTVILVDDGLAMGSTMRASIKMCRKQKPEAVVVAVPVAGERVKEEMERLADDTVVLETPPNFRAVAQVYENWYDVTDTEVIAVMKGS